MVGTLREELRGHWAELLVGLLIGLTIWVTTSYDIQKGSFQSLQVLYYTLFLLIGFIAMVNSAQTRVFTKRLLADKQRGKNGKKQ